MKKIIIFLFLVSCANPNLNTKNNYNEINFKKNLTFNEYEILLDEYNKSKGFPNINK